MIFKRVKPDSYLRQFIDFCRERYGDNLMAIGIYGSYIWGYFNKDKSDYDIFLVFNNKLKKEGKMLMNKFDKISVQYFCSPEEILQLVKKGHWSVYITFLTSAKMLYFSKNYKKFVGRLKKLDFAANLKDTKRIEWKAGFDADCIRKTKGYNGAKYALPALRSRLQLLTYIKYKKLIWDLSKNVNLNKDFLTEEEGKFLLQLNNSVKQRRKVFHRKNFAISLLHKINAEVISLLKSD